MSEPPSKWRQTELSLEDKLKLITDSESSPKPSLKVLSESYKIGKTTVSDILRLKLTYTEAWEKNVSGKKCRFGNLGKFDKLNDLLRDWFCSVRTKNIPVSGQILQEKASKFAAELDIKDFKASNGWLDSWKSRHSVKGFKVSGKSASVSEETVDSFKSRLPTLTSGYSHQDIFNCDETGLYYRALPDRTLAARGENTKGTKVAKERMTILFACSATGEKLTPLVIGKSANPRCLKNVKRENLGVTYVSNKKAWMTGSLFADWLRSVNADMKRKNCHILLFLDNASSHGHNINLSHVKLSYLPPNTTSHLQPLDQGIIRAFKALYRKYLLRSLLSQMDTSDDVSSLCRSVTLLGAIRWSGKAWNDVKQSTIQKCFDAAGIKSSSPADTNQTDSDEYEDDDVPISVLVQQLSFQLDELDGIDDTIDTEATDKEWEDGLIASYRSDEVTIIDSDQDEDKDVQIDEDIQQTNVTPARDISPSDILKFSSSLQMYALQKDAAYLELAEHLKTLTENKIVKARCAMKQTTMKDFFLVKFEEMCFVN